jgi:hypothetical protein
MQVGNLHFEVTNGSVESKRLSVPCAMWFDNHTTEKSSVEAFGPTTGKDQSHSPENTLYLFSSLPSTTSNEEQSY